jgi:hypothetical protein
MPTISSRKGDGKVHVVVAHRNVRPLDHVVMCNFWEKATESGRVWSSVKTDWNFVFFYRELYILYWLYIIVSYMSFYVFQFFAQNANVLAYGFNENR